MFIQELRLYVDYLRKEIKKASLGVFGVTSNYLQEFKQNIMEGIQYYQKMANEISAEQRNLFLTDLAKISRELELLPEPAPVHA